MNRFVDKDGNVVGKKDWDDAIKWLSSTEAMGALQEEYGIGLKDAKPVLEDARAFALAQSDKIQTNETVRDKLHTDAINIWRGAKSKEDFNQEIKEARDGAMVDGKRVYRYGDIESDQPLLGKQDYQSLTDMADTQLKSAQAEELSRYSQEARDQIVDYGNDLQFSEVLKALGMDSEEGKAAQDKRKLQKWYLSRYNQDLYEWIADNPDKSSKDFYVYSKSLLHTYRQNSSNLNTIERLQNEEFNIELSIPTGFDDVWDGLDNDRRTKVQSAIKNGYPIDQIKGAL